MSCVTAQNGQPVDIILTSHNACISRYDKKIDK
jgi:hypothetical protein